jgi:hemolysin activation/secretion protein
MHPSLKTPAPREILVTESSSSAAGTDVASPSLERHTGLDNAHPLSRSIRGRVVTNACRAVRPVSRMGMSHPRWNKIALTLVIALAAPVIASAQPALTGIPQPPPGSPISRMAPAPLPEVSPGGGPEDEMNANEVPNAAVDVRHVEIVGSTLFGDALLPYVDGLTGPGIPLVRLNQARQAILSHYRSRGYVLSTVSLTVDQTSGTVRYRVVEGRIAAVKLDGDIGPAGTMVLRFLNHLTEYPVIDTATLERYLLLAQDVPGVSMTTALAPSKDTPGALTLIAQVRLKHLSGQVAFDNRAFQLTGPVETLGILDLDSYSEWGDRTELSFFHSFPNSQNFGQASIDWFVGSRGLKVRVYAGAGVVNPTGILATLNYHGFTDIFGGQVSYPVIRSRRQDLNIYGALDALESTITTGPVKAQQSADEVRVVRAGADYAASDVLAGDTRPAANQISVRLSQGLEILGGYHGEAQLPSTARAGENHNFTAVRFLASRTQTLFAPWDGASVALMELLTGQYTADVLPPSEQFYLGGTRFTRGFYIGQEPGDKALAATVELQLNTTIDLTFIGGHPGVVSQFYLFYDWGETWQNARADFAARLVSAGGGVRTQITKYVEVDLEALDRFTTQPPPLSSSLNGIGLFARLVGRF